MDHRGPRPPIDWTPFWNHLRNILRPVVPDPEPGSFREWLCLKQGIKTKRQLAIEARIRDKPRPIEVFDTITVRYVDPPTQFIDAETFEIVDATGRLVRRVVVPPMRVRPYVGHGKIAETYTLGDPVDLAGDDEQE